MFKAGLTDNPSNTPRRSTMSKYRTSRSGSRLARAEGNDQNATGKDVERSELSGKN